MFVSIALSLEASNRICMVYCDFASYGTYISDIFCVYSKGGEEATDLCAAITLTYTDVNTCRSPPATEITFVFYPPLHTR